MPAAVDQCPRGHDTRLAAHRDSQGHCRKCKAENSRRKRASDGMKLATVRAFEQSGIEFIDDDGQAVAPADVVRQLIDLYENSRLTLA